MRTGDHVLREADGPGTLLRRSQNADGGWPYRGGSASRTEPTALAVLSLRSSPDPASRTAAGRGVEWLRLRQRSDGAWPIDETTPESSWTTSLTVLALSGVEEARSHALQGGRWLLGVEGRRTSRTIRLLLRLLGRDVESGFDHDLQGWPWVAGTFSWVEPTAYALLALKALRSEMSDERVEARLRRGEAMLLDRACGSGGWNSGGCRTLGVELWPYPATTALALIALQDHPDREVLAGSLDSLVGLTERQPSGLALSLAALCLDLFGRPADAIRRSLSERFAATGFMGELRSVCFATMALEAERNPLALSDDV